MYPATEHATVRIPQTVSKPDERILPALETN